MSCIPPDNATLDEYLRNRADHLRYRSVLLYVQNQLVGLYRKCRVISVLKPNGVIRSSDVPHIMTKEEYAYGGCLLGLRPHTNGANVSMLLWLCTENTEIRGVRAADGLLLLAHHGHG